MPLTEAYKDHSDKLKALYDKFAEKNPKMLNYSSIVENNCEILKNLCIK